MTKWEMCPCDKGQMTMEHFFAAPSTVKKSPDKHPDGKEGTSTHGGLCGPLAPHILKVYLFESFDKSPNINLGINLLTIHMYKYGG